MAQLSALNWLGAAQKCAFLSAYRNLLFFWAIFLGSAQHEYTNRKNSGGLPGSGTVWNDYQVGGEALLRKRNAWRNAFPRDCSEAPKLQGVEKGLLYIPAAFCGTAKDTAI